MTAMPVDPAAVRFIGPSTPSHTAFDSGTTTGGRFFSIGTGIVTLVELNTGQGLPGTNYRVWINYTSTGIGATYHFEIDGSVPEQTQRDNILVAVGDRVTAGQHIGNLMSQGRNAHVHFDILDVGGVETDRCPLEFFSPEVAMAFENLYDSGSLEDRSPLPDLCNTSDTPNPQLPDTQAMSALPVAPSAVSWMGPYGQDESGFSDHLRFGFGAVTQARVFSVGNGIVHSVEVRPFGDLTYRIRIQVTPRMTANYVFDAGRNISDDARRANMLVSVGETVTAGQLIGTVPAQTGDALLSLTFFDFDDGFIGCPVAQFSPSVAAQLEALYDSGIERRPSSRVDLCQ